MAKVSPDLLWAALVQKADAWEDGPAKEAVGRILEEHKPRITPYISEWCTGCEDDHFRECRTLLILFGVDDNVWDLEEWLYGREGTQ